MNHGGSVASSSPVKSVYLREQRWGASRYKLTSRYHWETNKQTKQRWRSDADSPLQTWSKRLCMQWLRLTPTYLNMPGGGNRGG